MTQHITRCFRVIVLTLLICGLYHNAYAVTGVNPSGVNVKANGTTTVFLTFQGLDADESSQESFFCGELITPLPANQVVDFNPCDPTTIFGRLPRRLDRSRISGTGGRRNLTDIMTIPRSVTRRALQAAQAGAASEFFYVRRFSNGQFAVVSCRMSGGGARTPLALTNVRMGFLNNDGEFLFDPVYSVSEGGELPKFGAQINYNGTGKLKGRWEVVFPGDIEPTEFDLLTEATLPAEERFLQRRYSVLERFEVFLTPVGETFLPGPRFVNPPTNTAGLHRILLRIEASDERDSRSNTGGGLNVSTGGVAGFPLPVLRYFVGTGKSEGTLQISIDLLAPTTDMSAQSMDFNWSSDAQSGFYKLEVQDNEGTEVLSALLKADTQSYQAPSWLAERSGEELRWRIIALDGRGNTVSTTEWRDFMLSDAQ